MTHQRRTAFVLLSAIVLSGSCGREAQQAAHDQPLSIADVGFQTPESVLHDSVDDMYLVSNVNGPPLAKDNNGFISRLTPDGSVSALRWIDSSDPAVTLHAPKGLAIRGDTLFVADIDAVRLFDRQTGASVGTWDVPGVTFLNDLAVADDGTLYVTDSGLRAGVNGLEPTGTDAVYRFDEDGQAVALVSGDGLGRPNGILIDDDRVVVVTFGSGQVILIDPESGQISGLPAPGAGSLDGIVEMPNGDYLISSWDGQAVYRMGAGGQYTVAVDSVEAPADIGFDDGRNRVLIPLFRANRVEVRPLE